MTHDAGDRRWKRANSEQEEGGRSRWSVGGNVAPHISHPPSQPLQDRLKPSEAIIALLSPRMIGKRDEETDRLIRIPSDMEG